jgi:hypothetical protein
MRMAMTLAVAAFVASGAQAQGAGSHQPRPQSGRVSAHTMIGDPKDGPSYDHSPAAHVRKDGKVCRLRNGSRVCLTPERWSEIEAKRQAKRAGAR